MHILGTRSPEVERTHFLRKGLVVLTDYGQTPVLCLCTTNV